MKAILIIIVLLIFLFRKDIEGQSFKKEEGFSFAEKDIRAAFSMAGGIKRDKDGKICKLSEKPVILEKELDVMTNLDLPKQDSSKQDEILNELSQLKDESQKKDLEKIVSKITSDMNRLDKQESKEMTELMNKLDILHLELKNSKNNDKMIHKLIDKIQVGGNNYSPPVKKENNNQILLIVSLLIVFGIGGFAIYYIMNQNNDDVPMTYREAVIRAKENLMKHKELI